MVCLEFPAWFDEESIGGFRYRQLRPRDLITSTHGNTLATVAIFVAGMRIDSSIVAGKQSVIHVTTLMLLGRSSILLFAKTPRTTTLLEHLPLETDLRMR